MPHCKFEKIFCLCGSGGNGKSKYLEMLRLLFGESNVTHITPRGLLDKFQRIGLKDSILNIAGEIKSDLRDTEEYIKLIASGEPISACYKSQDYVTFPSRAKLLFAMNGQLSSSDTSDGLTRRLIIVDFKTQFVDFPNPNNPYERLKNVNIMDELMQELQSGGIFNWVYEGYKLLDAVGYFTETNDQEELIREFKVASNPILQFYEDKITPHRPVEIKTKQLYADYQMWCVENGYLAKASNGFFREFKNVSKQDYEPFRTASERGYRLKNTR
jgi:putative DNA primase/helicase